MLAEYRENRVSGVGARRYVPGVRGSPGRQNNGWWVSPAIPTVANVVLSVLWVFTTLGGWGRTAFCGTGVNDSTLDTSCSDGFDTAIAVSAVPAFLALALIAFAWTAPLVRRDPRLLDALLTIAALTWLLAEGVLFIGGWMAQP
jgi:hypothetical protein